MTTTHPSNDPRIFLKECSSLAAAGYDVTLIATDWRPPLTTNGVSVLSLPRSSSRLKRMAFGPVRAAFAVWKLRPDLVHVHDPELIPLGLVFRLLGARVVFDAHEDLAAQVMSKPYLPPLARPPVRVFARWITRVADKTFTAIVAATPAIARSYGRAPVVVVQNYPIMSEWPFPRDAEAGETIRVAYVGGVSEIRGIWQILDALDFVAARAPIRLCIAGPVQPQSLLPELEAHPGWTNVHHEPWLSRREVARLLAGSTVGLVLFQPLPNHVESQPTKLFEYMAAGLPVIASDFPLWRRLVDGAGCGLLADPQNVLSIAGAMTEIFARPDLAEKMGRAGRRAIESRYSWESEAKELLALYAKILSSR